MKREWTALYVLMLPLLLVSMDVSVLYFAAPAISADLHPTGTQQLWIFDVYGFVLAGLLMTMGSLGDRIGRRKPIVLVAGLLIAGGSAIPLLLPTIAGVLLSSAIVGAGFGAFVAVDQALMSSLLPDPDAYAKDLGVLNLAATLPNTIAPLAAGGIVLALGYRALFIAAFAIALCGACAVLPIRRVR